MTTSLEKLNVDEPPDTFSQDQGGNSRLIFDLMLAHRWWREKSKDESKCANVTLPQLEDYAQALEREIVNRDIKIPVFNDEMPTIRKVWSESAREAALEARRANAKPPESISGHATKLHYALMPRHVIEKVKGDIEALPSEHTRDVKDIYIMRNLGETTWTDASGRMNMGLTLGQCDPETGIIKVSEREMHVEGGRQAVLYHEIAHVYGTKGLTKEQDVEWFSAWTNNRGKMPNSYAATNYKEGFAECYVNYQMKKPLEPGVQSWFENNIKRRG